MRDTRHEIGAADRDIARGPALVFLASILILALALRVVYVLQSRASPLFDDPQMDALYHVEWARDFAAGIDKHPGPFFRAPLYPWFLGLLFRLFGDDLLLPRLVQAAIGTLSCALVYLVGGRAFDRRTGLVAAAIAATYWILIYFDGELLLPVFEVPTCLLAIWLALRAGDARGQVRAGRVALAGLALGVAAIVRPNVLIVAPFFAGWLIWTAGPTWRSRARIAVSFTLALCAPILPLTAYNAIVGHDRVLISSQGGVNLYIGNNEHSDGSSAIVPGTRGTWWGGFEDSIALAEAGAGRKLKPSEVSDWYVHKSIEFWREHPGQALALVGLKLRLFWTDWELGNNQDDRFFALRFGPILRWLPIGFGALAPFGLLGFLLALRGGRRIFPVWVFVPLYTASVVAFFVCARFRVPVLPVLMVLAAHALFVLVDALRARRWWSVGLGAAFLVVVASLVQCVPARVDRSEAAGLTSLGNMTVEEDPREAVDLLRRATAENPRYVKAHEGLANALAKLGEYEQAAVELRRALALDATDPETWDELGRTELKLAEPLQRQNGGAPELRAHREAAADAFAHALELFRDPDLAFNAGYALGVTFMQLERFADALRAFDKALAARPLPDAQNWFWKCWLGHCQALMQLGRGDEARRDARRVIDEHPEDPAGPRFLREFLER